MTEKKKIQRISAGDVIAIKYLGDNKPCDQCMCITFTPMTIAEDGSFFVKELVTMFLFDTDKEVFINDFHFNNLKANVTKVKDKKIKKWYFEQIVRMFKTQK